MTLALANAQIWAQPEARPPSPSHRNERGYQAPIEQIDNPYVDHSTNGLSVVAERFKKERIAAHMVLAKGERSELAELAANLL